MEEMDIVIPAEEVCEMEFYINNYTGNVTSPVSTFSIMDKLLNITEVEEITQPEEMNIEPKLS